MAVIPSLESETLTSDERFRRWEQRGHDRDARFMRGAGRLFWAVLVLLAGVVLMAFLK